MSAISLLLINIFFHPLFAATFEAPVKEGDRLVVKGLEAQVQLVAIPGSNALKISGVEESSAEGAYVVEKKNNIIEVRMNEYGDKKTWMNILPKAASHMKKIEISGAAVPTEIHLRGGSVIAQRWNKDLKATLTNGRATSTGGAGVLDLNVQKGDIIVTDHSGKINADSYTGNMTLKNIQGDLDASLFAGNLVMEKIRGAISVSTQQAGGKLVQGSGTAQFENGKGTFIVQEFQGRIEGQTQDGTVSIKMVPDSEVDIKSKSGRVNVTAAPASGASVNLFTVDGDIFVPNELRVNKLSSEKNVRGRLRGESQRGSIFVRSQDGSIVVK